MGNSKWYYNEEYMLDRIRDYQDAVSRGYRSLRDMCAKLGWNYGYYRQLQRKRESLYDATYLCVDATQNRYYSSKNGTRFAGGAKRRKKGEEPPEGSVVDVVEDARRIELLRRKLGLNCEVSDGPSS